MTLDRLLRFIPQLFVSFAVIYAVNVSIVYGMTAGEDDAIVEIVWSESDGLRREIFVSSFKSGVWADPVMITDDNADNLHPSIDIGADGKKWVVWSAIENSSFEIRYSVFENGVWRDPKKIPSELSSNIKPSIVVDNENVPWVIWSGNNGDNDDIYYSRYIDGGWTKEQRIHEKNESPDILAFLDMDDDGNPVALWDSFRDDAYQKVQSTWDGSKWSEPIPVNEESQIEAEEEGTEVVLPEFVQDPRQVFLRIHEPATAEK